MYVCIFPQLLSIYKVKSTFYINIPIHDIAVHFMLKTAIDDGALAIVLDLRDNPSAVENSRSTDISN